MCCKKVVRRRCKVKVTIKTNTRLFLGTINTNSTNLLVSRYYVYFGRNPRLTKPLQFLTFGGRRGGSKRGRGGDFRQNTCLNYSSQWGKN